MSASNVVKVIGNPFDATNFCYQQRVHFFTAAIQLVNVTLFVITVQCQVFKTIQVRYHEITPVKVGLVNNILSGGWVNYGCWTKGKVNDFVESCSVVIVKNLFGQG